jgi:hypothetical protein
MLARHLKERFTCVKESTSMILMKKKVLKNFPFIVANMLPSVMIYQCYELDAWINTPNN